MNDTNLPRITVVTPSFNQAQFLEATILGVLGQQYPNLEYIVMDGGSKDGSVEIIRRYESQIAYWVSERDGGQSAAINTAFARATGDILCWINSDDFFLPGALLKIGRLFAEQGKESMLVYGSCLFFQDQGRAAKVVRPEQHDRARLALTGYIIQPSAFWTRRLWELTGPLDQSLSYAFDWDWFNRAAALGTFIRSPEIFSAYRFHEAHKSGNGSEPRRDEIFSVARRHAAAEQIAAYQFTMKHWETLRRRDALAARLGKWRVPGAPLLARLTEPKLWFSKVSKNNLRVCRAMLGDA
ncbi:MAG: glycosyl transferase family 2 [Chthoniobacteraceae bacterium]|nr:glycosyl transferase family 2 [Chthoniobacteraceae bacterium]